MTGTITVGRDGSMAIQHGLEDDGFDYAAVTVKARGSPGQGGEVRALGLDAAAVTCMDVTSTTGEPPAAHALTKKPWLLLCAMLARSPPRTTAHDRSLSACPSPPAGALHVLGQAAGREGSL